MSNREISYRGTNAQGNDYIVYSNGGFWYGNTNNGSSYADDGNNHRHWTRADGRDGWHRHGNRQTSGRQFRESDTRHQRHQRR